MGEASKAIFHWRKQWGRGEGREEETKGKQGNKFSEASGKGINNTIFEQNPVVSASDQPGSMEYQ